MITYLARTFKNFFYDEAYFQQYARMGMVAMGQLIQQGVIPSGPPGSALNKVLWWMSMFSTAGALFIRSGDKNADISKPSGAVAADVVVGKSVDTKGQNAAP